MSSPLHDAAQLLSDLARTNSRMLLPPPEPLAPPLRIYLAGPMTGYREFNYPAFNAAAAQLRAMGFDVANPAENPAPSLPTWENYMRAALTQMLTCQGVVLLPDWQDSDGALLEVDVALRLAIPVRSLANTLGLEVETPAPMAGVDIDAVHHQREGATA